MREILFTFVNHYAEMEARNEEWKEKLRQEWEDSKHAKPRKRKKELRKRIMVDWAFANWSPFDL